MAQIVRMKFDKIRGVTCDKELGSWTVRLNGHYIIDFKFWNEAKSEAKARNVAMRLQKALAD